MGRDEEAAHNQAFNVINGCVSLELDVGTAGQWFGLQPAPYPGEGIALERQLADTGPIWAEIARKHRLAETDLSVITSA
jgi:hypothetical protein